MCVCVYIHVYCTKTCTVEPSDAFICIHFSPAYAPKRRKWNVKRASRPPDMSRPRRLRPHIIPCTPACSVRVRACERVCVSVSCFPV